LYPAGTAFRPRQKGSLAVESLEPRFRWLKGVYCINAVDEVAQGQGFNEKSDVGAKRLRESAQDTW
jgi:hypothetical protein